MVQNAAISSGSVEAELPEKNVRILVIKGRKFPERKRNSGGWREGKSRVVRGGGQQRKQTDGKRKRRKD
ncbi:hypothetical protein SLE2022_130400 [Rubroshorea leprosula]